MKLNLDGNDRENLVEILIFLNYLDAQIFLLENIGESDKNIKKMYDSKLENLKRAIREKLIK